MSANPVCTDAVHAALVADGEAWSRLLYVGVQLLLPGEHVEQRNCACGGTLCRAPVGEIAAVCARYDRACSDGDIGAKYTCRRAMSGRRCDLQEWRDMMEMEWLIGGAP